MSGLRFLPFALSDIGLPAAEREERTRVSRWNLTEEVARAAALRAEGLTWKQIAVKVWIRAEPPRKAVRERFQQLSRDFPPQPPQGPLAGPAEAIVEPCRTSKC